MKIGYMKWLGNKLKVKCPYCGKEFTFTLKEITYGFLYPESIKCKFCDNFIELKDEANKISPGRTIVDAETAEVADMRTIS